MAALIRDLGVPFDFTIHDYFAACPQVTMTDAQGRYCGEPDDEGCNACIRERPCAAPDIAAWRAASRGLVESAERVIAPCPDAAARLVTAPHPEPNAFAEPRPVPLLANEPLRVAVLGSMVAHKGLAKLTECAALSKQRALPLEFRLIGEARGGIRSLSARGARFAKRCRLPCCCRTSKLPADSGVRCAALFGVHRP